MPTDPNAACWTGEDTASANADSPKGTDVTSPFVPRPRSPVPITLNGRPETTDPAPGDSFADLVMVLAIAGAFGLVLAVEVLIFCAVLAWQR